MKTKWIMTLVLLIALAVSAGGSVRQSLAEGPPHESVLAAQVPPGTAFTYQGQLKMDGTPVNGVVDFQFSLWDAATGGTQIGSTQTLSAVGVSSGLFTVQLDFGGNAFIGAARWLGIAVRSPAEAGGFVLLTPRQPLTPTPYALALPGLRTEQTEPSPNVIGGWPGNIVSRGVVGATIGGGGRQVAPNRVSGNSGTVSGGDANAANNLAAVGGGLANTASGGTATVGGGYSNTASGAAATIAGGVSNLASGRTATIGGGISNTASGNNVTVSGGAANLASGSGATIPGGVNNQAVGDASLAAGNRAKANHDGAFVWADQGNSDFPSTGPNSFNVRATGGTRFVSAVDSSGNPTAGVQLAPGGGSWSSLSDRALKENVAVVDPRDVLARLVALPVESWSYAAQDPAIRHVGPVAQDFYAAFGVGEDDKHITTIDADGVALAAIQGLYQEAQEKDTRISQLEAHNSELQQQVKDLQSENQRQHQTVDELQKRVAALEKLAETLFQQQAGDKR